MTNPETQKELPFDGSAKGQSRVQPQMHNLGDTNFDNALKREVETLRNQIRTSRTSKSTELKAQLTQHLEDMEKRSDR